MQTDLPFFYKYNNLPSLADTGPTALFTLCIFCSVTNRSPVSLPETVSYQLIQQRLAITSSMETYLETSLVPLENLKKFWILKKKKKKKKSVARSWLRVTSSFRSQKIKWLSRIPAVAVNHGSINRYAKAGNATGKCIFPVRWTKMKSGKTKAPAILTRSLSASQRRKRNRWKLRSPGRNDFPRRFQYFYSEEEEEKKKGKVKYERGTVNAARDREYSRWRLYL